MADTEMNIITTVDRKFLTCVYTRRWIINTLFEIYRVLGAQADGTLTHTSHKVTENRPQ
jgi:hypothetical protein